MNNLEFILRSLRKATTETRCTDTYAISIYESNYRTNLIEKSSDSEPPRVKDVFSCPPSGKKKQNNEFASFFLTSRDIKFF